MFKNRSGFSLVEVMIALMLVGIVLVGIGAANTWVTDWYYQAVEENTAEENLLLAAFHFKQFLGQSVETVCAGGGLGSPVFLAVNPAVPPFIGQGEVDCRVLGAPYIWPATVPGNPHALAVFNRETGGVASLAPGNYPASQFVGAGIYFQAPSGTNSGILFFAQTQPGTKVINLANAILLDHIVDVKVLQSASSTAGRLETITYRLIARYMLEEGGKTPISYLLNPPANARPYKDVTLDVDVGLRDNWLGVSASGSGTSERLHGGLYYFSTVVPLSVKL